MDEISYSMIGDKVMITIPSKEDTILDEKHLLGAIQFIKNNRVHYATTELKGRLSMYKGALKFLRKSLKKK